MTIALLGGGNGHVGAGGAGPTGAIDTSGADCLIAWTTDLGQFGVGVISDSKGNTWTPGAINQVGSRCSGQLWYCLNPTVGSGHTFSNIDSQTAFYGFVGVLALTGVAQSSPTDGDNNNSLGSGSTSIQPGSITPTVDGDIVVAGLALSDITGVSIDSSFTISDSAVGVSFGGSLAYLIQGTAGAINPTWTTASSSNGLGTVIQAFKAASGGGGTDYPLSASVGSFTLTGQSLTPSVGRPLTASPGSFTVTGESSTLSAGRPLSGTPGSFAISGQSASMSTGRPLTASVGSFTLTGQSTTLVKAKDLPASPGSFTITGQAQTQNIGYTLSNSPGVFIITGQNALTSWPRQLALSKGTFVLTGENATFLLGKGLSGTPGSFTLTGEPITIVAARSLALSKGTFTLTGQSATLLGGKSLILSPGSFTLTGQTLTVNRGITLDATHGIFTLTGQSAQLVASNVILIGAVIPFNIQFSYVQMVGIQFQYVQPHDIEFGD